MLPKLLQTVGALLVCAGKGEGSNMIPQDHSVAVPSIKEVFCLPAARRSSDPISKYGISRYGTLHIRKRYVYIVCLNHYHCYRVCCT